MRLPPRHYPTVLWLASGLWIRRSRFECWRSSAMINSSYDGTIDKELHDLRIRVAPAQERNVTRGIAGDDQVLVTKVLRRRPNRHTLCSSREMSQALGRESTHSPATLLNSHLAGVN